MDSDDMDCDWQYLVKVIYQQANMAVRVALTRGALAGTSLLRPGTAAGSSGRPDFLLRCTSARLKHYEVTGEGKGGASTSSHGQHVIRTDLPRGMGGRDAAPQPVELLLASLIGCETATASFVARQMRPRFPLDKITFSYVADRDERGALAMPIEAEPPVQAHLQAIRGTATVHLTQGAAAEALERLDFLKAQVERRCPVASMIRASGCVMDITWVLAQ